MEGKRNFMKGLSFGLKLPSICLQTIPTDAKIQHLEDRFSNYFSSPFL